jgi:hypothetical protein
MTDTTNTAKQKQELNLRSIYLESEIKRISNTTLRGNFSNPEDRKFWVERLKKLNSELDSIQEIQKKLRRK